MKMTERARDNLAFEELSDIVAKLEDKLKQTEIALENKNLEAKKKTVWCC